MGACETRRDGEGFGAGLAAGFAFGFGGAGSGVGRVGVGTVVGVGSSARALEGRKSPKVRPAAAASTDAPMANTRATRDNLLFLPVKRPDSGMDSRSSSTIHKVPRLAE